MKGFEGKRLSWLTLPSERIRKCLLIGVKGNKKAKMFSSVVKKMCRCVV